MDPGKEGLADELGGEGRVEIAAKARNDVEKTKGC